MNQACFCPRKKMHTDHDLLRFVTRFSKLWSHEALQTQSSSQPTPPWGRGCGGWGWEWTQKILGRGYGGKLPKMVGFSPKSSIFYRVCHEINHPFWRVSLLLETSISSKPNSLHYILNRHKFGAGPGYKFNRFDHCKNTCCDMCVNFN